MEGTQAEFDLCHNRFLAKTVAGARKAAGSQRQTVAKLSPEVALLRATDRQRHANTRRPKRISSNKFQTGTDGRWFKR
jgi:hypothetical protein